MKPGLQNSSRGQELVDWVLEILASIYVLVLLSEVLCSIQGIGFVQSIDFK